MKKSLLPALLVIFMHATLFGRQRSGNDKTASPITTTIVTPPGTIVTPAGRPAQGANPTLTLSASNTTGKALRDILMLWDLTAGGITRQKGKIPHLSIENRRPLLIHLAARIPSGNDETFLHLQYLISPLASQSVSTGSSLITEEWLPLRRWDGSHATILPAGELTFTDEDDAFTILSPTLVIRFAKKTGWLQHYEIGGYNLIIDSTELRPDFHDTDTTEGPRQQPTYNPRLQLFSTSTGSEIVIVRTEYTLPETHCHLHMGYTINASGDMEIQPFLEADSTGQSLPPLRFGMQWALPPGPDSITLYGRNPKSDGVPAADKAPAVSAISAAPAEIVRTATREGRLAESSGVRWWKVTGRDGKGLTITADSGLVNISCEPLPGKMPGVLLHIDYPAGIPSTPQPNGSYRYGFKISAPPKLPVRTLVSPAKRF